MIARLHLTRTVNGRFKLSDTADVGPISLFWQIDDSIWNCRSFWVGFSSCFNMSQPVNRLDCRPMSHNTAALALCLLKDRASQTIPLPVPPQSHHQHNLEFTQRHIIPPPPVLYHPMEKGGWRMSLNNYFQAEPRHRIAGTDAEFSYVLHLQYGPSLRSHFLSYSWFHITTSLVAGVGFFVDA
jgi:hypothetical protein